MTPSLLLYRYVIFHKIHKNQSGERKCENGKEMINLYENECEIST